MDEFISQPPPWSMPVVNFTPRVKQIWQHAYMQGEVAVGSNGTSGDETEPDPINLILSIVEQHSCSSHPILGAKPTFRESLRAKRKKWFNAG
jgi:hypothetical protein